MTDNTNPAGAGNAAHKQPHPLTNGVNGHTASSSSNAVHGFGAQQAVYQLGTPSNPRDAAMHQQYIQQQMALQHAAVAAQQQQQQAQQQLHQQYQQYFNQLSGNPYAAYGAQPAAAAAYPYLNFPHIPQPSPPNVPQMPGMTPPQQASSLFAAQQKYNQMMMLQQQQINPAVTQSPAAHVAGTPNTQQQLILAAHASAAGTAQSRASYNGTSSRTSPVISSTSPPSTAPALTPEVSHHMKQLIHQAHNFKQRGKYAEAIRVYDQVMQVDSSHMVELLTSQGICYRALKDHVNAMTCFTRVLTLDPTNWQAHNHIGMIYKDTDIFEQAIMHYKRAIQYGPPRPTAMDPANTTTNDTSTTNPVSPSTHQQSTSLPTTRSNSPTNKSPTSNNKNNKGEVNTAYTNMAIVLTDLGTRMKLAGNTDAAMSSYNEALTYDNTYCPAYFNLGVVYSECGLLDAALHQYTHAINHNPHYVEALCNIGVIYKNAGQLNTAIEYYERALRANPNFTIAANNLAIALTDLGTAVKHNGSLTESIGYYRAALSAQQQISGCLVQSGCCIR